MMAPNTEVLQATPLDNGAEACCQPVRITAQVLPVINFALQQNGVPMVRSITLENLTERDIEHIDLQITSTPAFAMPFYRHIDLLPAGKCLSISRPEVILDGEFLSVITERVKGVLRFTTKIGDALPTSHYEETTVLAYDQWHGTGMFPELLASFVTPNQPVVSGLVRRASEYLGNWTGDPSMDGYMSRDVNRILRQAAAIYAAIQEEGLTYVLPPPGFEASGQRIRLCDTVLEQKMGTCLDLTLLYASVLEAVGLHPLLITTPNHIFAGLWLEDKMFQEALQDDVSLITKRLASGIHEIAVAETTCVVKGKAYSFDEAQGMGEQNLSQKPIEYIIDVHRARAGGILPLWQKKALSAAEAGSQDSPSGQGNQAPPATLDRPFASFPVQEEEQLPKKVRWERKLLDLGMRNSLINLRLTKNQLPLLVDSLDELENALSDGSDFTILPKPDHWPGGEFSFDTLSQKKNSPLIQGEFQNKRLRSVLTDTELAKVIKDLYRTAKTALEENGANTLYLALGMLRWYETPKSVKARYAPLILVPIELIRKSAAQGYVIRLRDDEAQMNITLLEKLKQDFSIAVTGTDPLPTDDHGIDIRRVLTVVRQAIMEQARWDVLEIASIGIFSFSQFVMWNDIRNRSQDLMNNKIVRSLMDGKLSWDAEPLEMGDRVSEENVLLPMSADASQLYAIQAACKGHSFVLHGPPGTGKSQTITSLIANALANGKTVLFVAEKIAALEVVQKRLDKIGVGPFCLELHSNKSRKKDVLEQLRQATEVTKTQSPQDFAAKAKQLNTMRRELDDYARQLHSILPCGTTLHSLINEYESFKDAPEAEAFSLPFIQGVDRAATDRQQAVIECMVAAGEEIGHPHRHPLERVRCTPYSQGLKNDLRPTVANYQTQLEQLIPHANRVWEATGLSCPDSLSSLEALVQVASHMVCWYEMPGAWTRVSSPQLYFPQVMELADHCLKANTLEEHLLEHFDPGFLTLDGQQLLTEYKEASGKWFLPKMLGTNKLSKTLRAYAKTSVPKEQVQGYLETLRDYQVENKTASELLEKYGGDLGPFYTGKTTDWKQIADLAATAQSSAQALYQIRGNYDLLHEHCGSPGLKAPLYGLRDSFPSFQEGKKAFDALLEITPRQEKHWLEEQLSLCRQILSHSGSLKEWIAYVSTAKEAEALGLDNIVRYYEAGGEHHRVFPAYKKALLQGLINHAIDEADSLNSFSGAIFNKKISRYKILDEEWCRLSQEETYCRLASKVPNFTKEAAQSSELGILQRAIKSGGRGISIRRLFDQLPNLLPRLCPCMLMSPISAAQYLDPKRAPFDVVVFDEASQLPTCKAVGVLARGKDAIIVGDPNQMPPTAFFATNTIDEDNPDMEDLESILDDCLALNMPQSHLLWHYRSRHESLIAFSNSQFYENKLFTFPSVNDRESKVKLVRVEGVFDRGKTRTNKAEAQAVVEEVKRRAKDPLLQNYSVGIVTFNLSQQHLIDDLLSEACVQDPQLEKWILREEEPLFVKNLENVQGDERDVILFSIGFGPDPDGKVFMNFGPLNRDGGWRRLNVAVSRSRHEMMVFTTLKSEQIDLNRTKAEGVAALRKFLEYAEGRPLALEESAVEKDTGSHKGIATAICKALEEKGYETDLSVGRSKYRIDIGVIDPRDPEQYILGIMLDGPVYSSSKTTRDRELAQISVLKGLGWETLRIWSMDWWDNPQKELKRIADTLLIIQKQKEAPKEVSSAAPPAEAPAPVQKPSGVLMDNASKKSPAGSPKKPPVYKAAHLPIECIPTELFTEPRYQRKLLGLITKLLEKEAPVCHQILMKRVTQSCGISRAGTRIQGHINALIRSLELPTTQQEDITFYWQKDQEPRSYVTYRVNGEEENRRDIREIPKEEIINALCLVLYEQISMSREDLFRETANALGFTRLSSNVIAAMEQPMIYAVGTGILTTDSNGHFVLTPHGTTRAEATLQSF